MLEPALFGHDRVPGNMLNLADDGLPIEVRELHALRCNYCEVAIGEEE